MKKNSLAKRQIKAKSETIKRLYNNQFKIKRKYSNYINQKPSFKYEETPIEDLKISSSSNNLSRNMLKGLRPTEDQSRISFGIWTPIDSDSTFPKRKISFSNDDNFKEEATTSEKGNKVEKKRELKEKFNAVTDLNVAISQIKEEIEQNKVLDNFNDNIVETEIASNENHSKEAQKALKGKKIFIKRDLVVNEENKTLHEEIIRMKENDNNEVIRYNEIINKRRKKQPSSKIREMYLNKTILYGEFEDDKYEESNEDEKEGVQNEFHHEKHNADEDLDDPIKTSYLEKFNYFYRSSIISTGTISIVMTANKSTLIESVPNPFAVSHGNLVVDEWNSSLEDEEIGFEEKGKLKFEKANKSPLK